MRVNPLGWAYLEKFSSAQLNEIDLKLSALEDATGGLGTFYVDGRGGTYSIINGLLRFEGGNIEFGADTTVVCSGACVVEGSFSCTSAATAAFGCSVSIAASHDLTVGRDVSAGRNLNVAFSCTCGSFTCYGAVTLGDVTIGVSGSITCAGPASFPGGITGPVTLNSTANVVGVLTTSGGGELYGNQNVHGNLNVLGPTYQQGVVTYSGTGRALEATFVPANPGSATPVTISSLSHRHVFVVGTSDVYAWHFDVANDAGDNEWIEFIVGPCSPALVVTFPSVSPISMNNNWLKARRIGGNWVVLHFATR